MIWQKKRGGFFEALGKLQSTNSPITDAEILKAIDEHVGRQFRAGRLFCNVKLTQLSGGLGLSYQQFQKYQTGGDRLSASRMYQIASFLKLSPAFFFDGLPLMKTEPLPVLKKVHLDLIRSYEAMPAKSRKDFLQIAKIMGGENV